MDIYFGRASVDEVTESESFAIQVCDAIRNGGLREDIKSLFGREFVTSSRLELSDGRCISDRTIRPLGILLFPLLRSRVIQYEAW
jgi:hypothetical protein